MPRILAIDDDPVVRRLILKLLGQAGYDASAVAGGRDAILQLEDDPLPDGVICDMLMPGMTGVEVVTALRTRERTAEIPILVLTGQVSTGDREEAMRAGADLFMIKPFSSYEFLDQVRSLLTTRRRAA